MPFSIRCRYCRATLLTNAEELGQREARVIRAHLAWCYPNAGRLPRTIGELLRHVGVTVAAPRPTLLLGAVAEARGGGGTRAVLVVTEEDRSAVAERLGVAGFAVALAHDAVDALRWLHASTLPCAIVLDIDGGLKLASWVAHHPTYSRVALLGIARGDDVRHRVVPTEVAEVFVIPADVDALVAAIARRCAPG